MSALSNLRAPSLAVCIPLLIVGLGLPQGRATAQTDGEAAYRALVTEAIAEYEARNFPEARALFARAHALSGNARTLRGLGMVAFELREYAESVARLSQALESQARPLEGKLRTDTEALLARARAFVAWVELRVEPAIDAQVYLDGVKVELDAQRRLLVAVGNHEISVAARGYLGEARTVKVMSGEDQVLHVELRPQTATSAAPTAAQTARAGYSSDAQPAHGLRDAGADEESGSVLTSVWFWSAVVLVVGGGVVAGVLVANSGDEVEAPLTPRSGTTVQALEIAP